MSGKPSDRGDKPGKNKTNAVATPLRGIMSAAQEDSLLTTRHQILMENYESLKQDYASLEQRFKLVEEMNAMMKPRLQNQNQSKELEAANLGLLKEKEEYKMMVEEMKSQSEATINELRIRNDELLAALEKLEEEKERQENKYDELAKRCDEMEKECAHLRSLYEDAKKLNGCQGKNNVGLEDDVFVVGENLNVVNNNNTVSDVIVLSDESDAETDHPSRESNINTPMRGVIKQEVEGISRVNSPQVKRSSSSKVKLPSFSSSSSSSDDVYIVPFKRSRVDGYNKTC